MNTSRYQVDKAEQDQMIEDFVDQLLIPDSLRHVLPPEKILDALRRLALEGRRDYVELLDQMGAPPESYPDPARMQQLADHLGECAWNHFREHAAGKFQLAVTELMNESLMFAESIYAREGGEPEEVVDDFLPTRAKIHQNVLQHSIQRLNQLKTLPENADWPPIDFGEELKSLPTEAARVIYSGLSLWAYDQVALVDLIKQHFRQQVGDQESPDEFATHIGNEVAEFIWEQIDGAMRTILLILVRYAFSLVPQSAAKRHQVALSDREIKQRQPSAKAFEGFARDMIDVWIHTLPYDLRGPGRPSKTPQELQEDRDRLWAELTGIANRIVSDGGKITWIELARRRNLPMDRIQDPEDLRREADRFDISLPDLKSHKN